MGGGGDLWSLPSLFLPLAWEAAGGRAVPLSFPSARRPPAPKGLRSWSSGEGEELSLTLIGPPSPRKHEQERQQEVRGTLPQRDPELRGPGSLSGF